MPNVGVGVVVQGLRAFFGVQDMLRQMKMGVMLDKTAR